MGSPICVDANVFVKVLVQEEHSDLARRHWERWTIAEGRRVIVPTLFPYEVVAVLRRKVYQGQLAPQDGSDAVDILLDANLELVTASELHSRAWELAQRLQRPTVYDAHYLALAEMERCEFWTADGRLYHSVKDHFPLIRWLGESEESL